MSKRKIPKAPARTARRLFSIALLGALVAFPGLARAQGWMIDPRLLLNCIGCQTTELVTGPDGEFWFTQIGAVGKVNLQDEYQIYPLADPNGSPGGIAAGPDGNLWVSEPDDNNIGRVTTAGAITEFPIPTSGSRPLRIAAGPDGNLWFTESSGNQIGRITPAGAITEFAIPTTNSNPQGITAGPDGNLWFTELLAIGRITPGGIVTEFPLPTPQSYPQGITAGPDGNLWFTMTTAQGGAIGRMTTAGTVAEYTVSPLVGPLADITATADGNLWFATLGGTVGRITLAGAVTTYVTGPCGEGCGGAAATNGGIARGPDGYAWFTMAGGDLFPDLIARISFQAPTASSIPVLDWRGLAALAALLAGVALLALRRA